MAVAGLNRPDFRTVSDFRKRQLTALWDVFVQVLRWGQRAGLVKPGHVAVDGAKLKANASRHKATSHRRMVTEVPTLAAQVKAWLDQAETADQTEDAQHGHTRRGDEMPHWAANKPRRLERIRQAKAQREAEAAGDPADDLDPDAAGPSSGMQQRGARKDSPSDRPPDKAPRNFTDRDGGIMPCQGRFIAGYNGQIAVDGAHRVITAHRHSTNPADFSALVPLIDQTRTHLGHNLREVSGDTGFASEANIAGVQNRKINAYLCPGRVRHGSTEAPCTCLGAVHDAS